jgi:hypothetical protein
VTALGHDVGGFLRRAWPFLLILVLAALLITFGNR